MKRVLASILGASLASFLFASPASATFVDGPNLPPAHPSRSLPRPLAHRERGSPPRVVVVRAGDTLSQIAADQRTTWAALWGYNHLADPNLILVGWRLVVPPAGYVSPRFATSLMTSSSVADFQPSPRGPSSSIDQSHSLVTYTSSSRSVISPTGFMGSFQACVMLRESSNGAGSPNLYGILDSTWHSLGLAGSAWTASRATQDAAFAMLYARDGTQPWAPYDGC